MCLYLIPCIPPGPPLLNSHECLQIKGQTLGFGVYPGWLLKSPDIAASATLAFSKHIMGWILSALDFCSCSPGLEGPSCSSTWPRLTSLPRSKLKVTGSVNLCQPWWLYPPIQPFLSLSLLLSSLLSLACTNEHFSLPWEQLESWLIHLCDPGVQHRIWLRAGTR